jgi:hypothetical protein
MLYHVNDNLKIQDEEALSLLSESGKSIIMNIKLKISMHTALIFKEQAKIMNGDK